MRTGISSFTFPWAIGVPGYPSPSSPLRAMDLLERAKELDAAVLQIADNLPLDRLPSSELIELGKAAHNAGIVLEVGTRGVEPSHLQCYLGIARSIGAKFLRTLTHTRESQPGLSQVESYGYARYCPNSHAPESQSDWRIMSAIRPASWPRWSRVSAATTWAFASIP